MRKFSPNLKIIAVFVAGLVLGSVLTKVFQGPPRPPSPIEMRKHILRKLSSNLELSPEQKVKFEAIIKSVQAEFIDYRVKHQDEIKAIVEKSIVAAKKELSPEQQGKLDQIYKERIQKRWSEEMDKSRLE